MALGLCGFLAVSRQTSVRLPSRSRLSQGQISPDKTVNFPCTTASFTVCPKPSSYPAGSLHLRCVVPTRPRDSAFYDVSVPFGKSAPTSARSFAAGFLSLRQATPTDPSSRKRPCLKLVVVHLSAPIIFEHLDAGSPTGDFHPMSSRPCWAYTIPMRRTGVMATVTTLQKGLIQNLP